MKRLVRVAGSVVLAGTVGLVLTAGACGSQGKIDAPVDQSKTDNQAPFIVNSPNTFQNVALKCVNNDLVATHTREAPPVIIADASACDPGVAEQIGIPRVRGIVPGVR